MESSSSAARPGTPTRAKETWERQGTPTTCCSSRTSTPREALDHKTLLASGACPLSTFPNDHLKVPAAPRWAAPKKSSPVQMLREAVVNTDWQDLYAEGRTLVQADPAWASNEERAQLLQALCRLAGARRVLEVGSFVGVASVAMAEVLPEGGQVVSLEIDPFLADFGRRACAAAGESGRRVHQVVGPAKESLKALAEQAKLGEILPFDFVLLDADKAGALEYLSILWDSPGLLSDRASVCVDVSEDHLPERYRRFGHGHHPKTEEEALRALRTNLQHSEKYVARELCKLLVVTKKSA